MPRQSHHEWYDAVTALRVELASDPTNLELARRVWDRLSGSAGFDVRSGQRVIETFRSAAIASEDGVEALVDAFRQLANDTGELPRPALFDPLLENTLRMHMRSCADATREDIEWILKCIEPDS